MKKYLNITLVLALAGAAISGALLIQHFYPEISSGPLSCGEGLTNSCISISLSDFSYFIGIPLAAWGLLFYLFILFFLLVCDYASDKYRLTGLAFVLPLSLAALLIDIALLIILIKLDTICRLCILTYTINFMIFITMLIWYRSAKKEGFSYKNLIHNILNSQKNGDRKAVLSLTVILIFFLTFSVFSSTYIMKLKSGNNNIPRSKIQSFLKEFYQSKKEIPELNAPGMAAGAPEADIKIIVFTDFLCSACYQFFKTEKYLFSKFKDKIKVTHYQYPLDNDCNFDVKKTIYKNSCSSSKALTAAYRTGVFENYLVQHFSEYKKIRKDYSKKTAVNTFQKLGTTDDKIKKFTKMYESKETVDYIKRDINLAVKNKINATPTIFIAGRKMEGLPPAKFLAAIIENELKISSQKKSEDKSTR